MPIVVHVDDERGEGLAGAELVVDGQPMGTTDTTGVVRLHLDGPVGQLYEARVRCPAEYRSPSAPLPLRRVAVEGAGPAEHRAVCHSLRRTVVVAVRAENGADLPILYLGKEVARTDASGAAHVSARLQVGERFELTLLTDVPGREGLRPKNPVFSMEVGETDQVVPFDVTLTLPSKPKAKPKPRGPTRID